MVARESRFFRDEARANLGILAAGSPFRSPPDTTYRLLAAAEQDRAVHLRAHRRRYLEGRRPDQHHRRRRTKVNPPILAPCQDEKYNDDYPVPRIEPVR
jgi:hypothetical protein